MAEELDFGIKNYEAGNKEEARRIFLKVIKEHPNYTKAYMWLYKVSYNDNERMNILKRVLQINPIHEEALALYRELSKKLNPPSPVQQPKKRIQPPVPPAPPEKKKVSPVVLVFISFTCVVCIGFIAFSNWLFPTIDTPEEYASEYDGSIDAYREILGSNDCAFLQEKFDIAYEANQSSEPGTIYSKRSLGFMTAADERMREIGCYE